MRKLRTKRLALSLVTVAVLASCDDSRKSPAQDLVTPPDTVSIPDTPKVSEVRRVVPNDSEQPKNEEAPSTDGDAPLRADDAATVETSGVLKALSGETQGGEAGSAGNNGLAGLSTNKVRVGGALGSGGLGMRGIGSGGGAVGYGRVGGLGKVDTGGGKGTGGRVGKKTGYGHGAGNLGERSSQISRRTKSGIIVGAGRGSYGSAVAVGSTGRMAYTTSGKGSISQPQVRGYDGQSSEDYTNYGTNSFVDPSKDRHSTFSIDVDTGSYTIARRKLNGKQRPQKAAVRVEEFVNYFDYGYAGPKKGSFSVDLEAAPSPFSAEANTMVMRVGIQGKKLTKSSRKPVHLTFLVDVSGSMSQPDKLGLVQKSLSLLTRNLQPDDTVAIATYAGHVAEVLPQTGAREQGKIMSAIENLRSGGSTAMNDGLKLAYKLAMKDLDITHVNRVVVLSDGDANVGSSSHTEILKSIRSYVEEGVTLSTIGFGMGNYKDTMMEQLANKGNGNYYYIDTIKESKKVFGEQLDGTLQVIAKDVKIQVEFDPDAVKAYRLIGYENRDIADKDFRNDKVDAGEIGAGHNVTALYEVKLKSARPSKIATVRVRHKEPQGFKAQESEFYLTNADIRPSVGQSSKGLQFATAVAGFAEILRGSPYAKDLSYDLILEVAEASHQGKKDRKELIRLIKKAKSLDRS